MSESTNQIDVNSSSQVVQPETENNQEKPKELDGKPISEFVDQNLVNQITEMGFSKVVAEKACFFNPSCSLI